MNSTSENNDIDLIRFIFALWKEKWLLIFFVILSTSLGFFVSLKQEVKYKSIITIDINNIPPVIRPNFFYNTFKKTFESKDFFETWKKDNSTSKIIFDNISPNKIVDDILLSKDSRTRFANLKIKKKLLVITVKTNDISLLDDLYNYCNDINSKLSKEQYLLSKRELIKAKELVIREPYLLSTTKLHNNVYFFTFRYFHYISQFNNGLDLFNINRPTVPTTTSIPMSLKIGIYAFVGGILGLCFMIFKDALRNYNKNHQAKRKLKR